MVLLVFFRVKLFAEVHKFHRLLRLVRSILHYTVSWFEIWDRSMHRSARLITLARVLKLTDVINRWGNLSAMCMTFPHCVSGNRCQTSRHNSWWPVMFEWKVLEQPHDKVASKIVYRPWLMFILEIANWDIVTKACARNEQRFVVICNPLFPVLLIKKQNLSHLHNLFSTGVLWIWSLTPVIRFPDNHKAS